VELEMNLKLNKTCLKRTEFYRSIVFYGTFRFLPEGFLLIMHEIMRIEQDEISTIFNECNRKVLEKEKHKQNEINACLRCGGDKCVCDRGKQHTTKITTKSLRNSP
jgi:hypothetical protein